MPVVIGSQTDVPASGDPIVSPWYQDTARKLVHQFANTTARDAWTTRPTGAMAWTTGDASLWVFNGSTWLKVAQDSKLGALQTYTPAVGGTGWALGAGSVQGYYRVTNNVCQFWTWIQFGAGATFSAANAMTITLPVAPVLATVIRGVEYSISPNTWVGSAALAASAITAIMQAEMATTATGPIRRLSTNSTTPGTWASTSVASMSGSYLT